MTAFDPRQIPTVSFYLSYELSAIHITSLCRVDGGYYTHRIKFINTIPTSFFIEIKKFELQRKSVQKLTYAPADGALVRFGEIR